MDIARLVGIIESVLGPSAEASVIEQLAAAILSESTSVDTATAGADRAAIAIVGIDRAGILASIAGAISGHGHNILNVSMSRLEGYFALSLLVEVSSGTVRDLQNDLAAVAEQINCKIVVQHEQLQNIMQGN